ncbi:hypothetical protein CR513_19546, partial [Mucuna pruriens]
METGGKRDSNQASQLTEQGNKSPNNSHLEVHPSSSSSPSPSPSQSPLTVPSDATNNTSNECMNNATSSTNPDGSTNDMSMSGLNSSPTNNNTPSLESGENDVRKSSKPKHGHDDVAGGSNQGSEIQNPPVQVMERPGESGASPDHYTFPSHVFSKSNISTPVEWSTASNESLFSIYMGNTSFSNELGCFKSGELDKYGACVHDQPNASPTRPPPSPANKFNDISQRTAQLHEESSKATEAKAAETMREVIMESSRRTTDNVGGGDEKASNSHRCSDGSDHSYAFQSLKSREKSTSSKGVEEKQNQQKQPEENETPNAAAQAPKSTTNAPNKWLNCFACSMVHRLLRIIALVYKRITESNLTTVCNGIL